MQTKLMRKLLQDDNDSDECENSFGDLNSEGEVEDEEDDEEEEESLESPDKLREMLAEDDEEDEEDEEDQDDNEDQEYIKPFAPVQQKRPLRFKKTIFDILNEPEKPKKYRRNVMNVFCTEYDIVKRVARKHLDYRLKNYEEDHEGAVVNGEGN
jgi:hypothetical protein